MQSRIYGYNAFLNSIALTKITGLQDKLWRLHSRQPS
jgi:hypothetical protein